MDTQNTQMMSNSENSQDLSKEKTSQTTSNETMKERENLKNYPSPTDEEMRELFPNWDKMDDMGRRALREYERVDRKFHGMSFE